MAPKSVQFRLIHLEECLDLVSTWKVHNKNLNYVQFKSSKRRNQHLRYVPRCIQSSQQRSQLLVLIFFYSSIRWTVRNQLGALTSHLFPFYRVLCHEDDRQLLPTARSKSTGWNVAIFYVGFLFLSTLIINGPVQNGHLHSLLKFLTIKLISFGLQFTLIQWLHIVWLLTLFSSCKNQFLATFWFINWAVTVLLTIRWTSTEPVKFNNWV